MPSIWLIAGTVFGVMAALLYAPAVQFLTTVGVFRTDMSPMHGSQLKLIPDTLQCEDLHHDLQSNLLFTACQTDDPGNRRMWFPPLAHFDKAGVGQGTIVVVDPKTFESTRLILKGFSGPFVTHGIDIFSLPADPSHLTIFAINHLPNPEHSADPNAPKGRSQIEVFRHTIGTNTAQHVRSIRDPLIRTPNDIYATSPTSFYVTNDHYYREGALREIEDFAPRPLGSWTDTVHISFSDMEADPAAGVTVTPALSGLHTNNGLGHGSASNPSLVFVGDPAGGEITVATRSLAPRPREPADLRLRVLEHIQLDSAVDNPSWYDDPYCIPAVNASGLVVAGLARAIRLKAAIGTPGKPIPVMVWHVTPQPDGSWQKKLIFQDDGSVISSAATAVMVAVDPAENEGKKQAWLFVTGFLSDAMVASLVDL